MSGRPRPAFRALAVTANNLALALEQAAASPARDSLLREAKANSRRFWEIAGTGDEGMRSCGVEEQDKLDAVLAMYHENGG